MTLLLTALAWGAIVHASLLGQVAPFPTVTFPGTTAPGNLTGEAPSTSSSSLNSSTTLQGWPSRSPLLPNASAVSPGGLPTLSDLPSASEEASPTDSGAALAGVDGYTPSATTSEIGAARRYLYKFQIGARAVFDDNIFLSSTEKQSDEFLVLNARVTLGLGDPTGAGNYLRFEYSPDASFYVAFSENNAVQHSVNLTGLYQFAKLTVSGRFEMRILDGSDITTTTLSGAQATQANLDVNGRTRLNLYTGQANFHYAFTEKTSGDLAGQYSLSDYEVLISSQSLSASFFGNYIYSPKLTFGAGLTIGAVLSEPPNPDQTYYQANLRTNYEVTGKLSVSGTFGLELRQSDSSSDSEVGPVFDLNAIYLPFDGSAVSLSGSRRVTPSAVEGGQSYALTDFSISLRQRFFQRFFASLTAGYQNSIYVSDLPGVSATREDNYFYFQPGLDFTVHETIVVGLNFIHRESQSNLRLTGFDNNQVSVFVSFGF